jgi:outer membrane protein assembly complex protein YaeT
MSEVRSQKSDVRSKLSEKSVFCFLSYVFAICVLCAITPIYASRTTQYEIGSIRIEGNVSISDAEILSRVRSRVGELFDQATADEDAKRIARLPGVEYGYYNTETVDNKVQLTFVVVERNLVRSIAFVGNRAYRANALRQKLGFKVGDYLDPTMVETYRGTLVEFYLKKGFAFVQIALDSEQLSVGKVIYTINEGPRPRVTKVSFSGNSAIKTRALRGAIKTRTTKWFVWPAYYVEEKPAEDVARLQNIYQAKGFLDAKITARREFSKSKRKVRITFVIDEGPAYIIERIVLTGNEHFDEKQLRAKLKLEQGQIYNERKAGSDVNRLLKFYRENGFIDVEVGRRRGFVSEGKVNVEFEITEGERFRIGLINITGNEQTQDKVVRRVLDEYDFQPGQWYNADIARGDGSGYLEKLLRRTALTEAATITPSGEAPGQKDAQVNIIEGQTGMVMVGGGVSSDMGLIGQLVFEQRNFDIGDWPESFGEFITGRAFKGAGQNLRIALQPGTEVSEYSINFTEPYFRDKPISLNVVGLGREWDRECYDEGITRGYVGFERRYKNRWRRSIGFRMGNVEVESIDIDAPKEIKDFEGDNALAGVRLGIGRDLTDDRFNPTKGYSFNAGYEQVGGDHTFGILSGTYRRYGVLYEDLAGRRTILATKLLAATVIGNAPPFEKFYAGGTGTYGIRGFDYRGVSTRGVPTTAGGVPIAGAEEKDPIGSDWVFLANAEVTVPLVGEEFSALFFIDSGAIDSGNYRASVGTGIQILIPQWFGPVPMRIGVAAPFLKDGADDTETFFFSVGRLF